MVLSSVWTTSKQLKAMTSKTNIKQTRNLGQSPTWVRPAS